MKLAHVKNLARLIPNATSYINEGYNPLTFASGFDPSVKKEVLTLLGSLGTTFEVSEDKLEIYAIMSAMLPTYFWFQWRELASIGDQIGLSEEEARKSIYETIVASS
jgi:pyrroline-5-carboxylate reductase